MCLWIVRMPLACLDGRWRAGVCLEMDDLCVGMQVIGQSHICHSVSINVWSSYHWHTAPRRLLRRQCGPWAKMLPYPCHKIMTVTGLDEFQKSIRQNLRGRRAVTMPMSHDGKGHNFHALLMRAECQMKWGIDATNSFEKHGVKQAFFTHFNEAAQKRASLRTAPY